MLIIIGGSKRQGEKTEALKEMRKLSVKGEKRKTGKQRSSLK